ncbi:MAG: T9SS type A sorting domain-containing protein [Paludibacteraceae bacterium]|nr:T9SS type A sorting domain-containing protein [Paludibacteraceae bacterium]
MKRTVIRMILIFPFMLMFFQAQGQVGAIKTKHVVGKQGIRISMPSFNKKELLKEDSINEQYKEGGMRFAQKFTVDLTPDNSGESVYAADGSRTWKVNIVSDSAYSINILFTKFHLVAGDTVYVYNVQKTRAYGPLTEKDNLKSGQMPIPPIDGDSIIVEFRQSATTSNLRSLQIGEVNHDYRGFRALPQQIGITADSCSQHASCVTSVSTVKQSVCLLIIDGSTLCSGTLVNNTAQNGKPYLLTASHCFGENTTYTAAKSLAPSVIAFLNYEAPNCTPTVRGSIEFYVAGSTLRALAGDIDFALLELSSTPPVDARPYYAGWNISTSPTPPFRGIHQPYGTVKRVATENDNITTASYGSYILSDSHWRVAKWDIGTTDAGSSGSGLFDSSLKLVGALTGGNSVCSNPINDYYYRLNKAWTYYSSDSTKQLKVWLDPTASGVTSLNGLNPYGKDSAVRVSNFTLSDTPKKAYLSSGSGLIAGQNSLKSTNYAEKFTLSKEAYLYGVYLMPSIASSTSVGNLTLSVYASVNDTVPESAYLLSYTNVSLSALSWNSTSSSFSPSTKTIFTNNENYVRFSTPIAVGKKFFISYNVSYSTDSFAIFTAAGRTSGGTAYVKKENGEWVSMYNFAGLHTSLWIDPVIRYDTTAKVITDSSLIRRSESTVVYPNPAKDIIYVMTRDNVEGTGTCTVRLYNFTGQLISTTEGNIVYQPISIDLHGVNSGVYFLRIIYPDKSETHKIIVNK